MIVFVIFSVFFNAKGQNYLPCTVLNNADSLVKGFCQYVKGADSLSFVANASKEPYFLKNSNFKRVVFENKLRLCSFEYKDEKGIAVVLIEDDNSVYQMKGNYYLTSNSGEYKFNALSDIAKFFNTGVSNKMFANTTIGSSKEVVFALNKWHYFNGELPGYSARRYKHLEYGFTLGYSYNILDFISNMPLYVEMGRRTQSRSAVFGIYGNYFFRNYVALDFGINYSRVEYDNFMRYDGTNKEYLFHYDYSRIAIPIGLAFYTSKLKCQYYVKSFLVNHLVFDQQFSVKTIDNSFVDDEIINLQQLNTCVSLSVGVKFRFSSNVYPYLDLSATSGTYVNLSEKAAFGRASANVLELKAGVYFHY